MVRCVGEARVRWVVTCTVVLFSGLVSVTTMAQEYPSLSTSPQVQETGENDAVLIVGVGDYIFLDDIDGVVETVNDWEIFFERGLGMRSSQMFTLMDHRATRELMEDFAERAADAVGDGGTLWFVFVGHGAPTSDGKDGVLVGVDAQSSPRSLEARGIRRRELVETLQRGKQARTLVFIDACFSGRTQEGGALAEGMQPVVPDRTDESFKPAGSTLVIAAAQADEFAGALPGMRRPAFSYVMLGALRGWAADDEVVTASEAIGYARRTLRHLDHSQTPDVQGDDDMVLVRGAVEEEPELVQSMRSALHGETEKSGGEIHDDQAADVPRRGDDEEQAQEQTFDQGVSKDEASERTEFLRRAEAKVEKEEYESAAKLLRQVLELESTHPNNPEVHHRLIATLQRGHYDDDALAERRRWVAAYGPESTWFAQRRRQGDDETIGELEQWTREHLLLLATTEHEHAQIARNEALARQDGELAIQAQENYQRAADTYARFLEYFPDDEKALQWRYQYADALERAMRHRDAYTQHLKVREWDADANPFKEISARRAATALEVVIAEEELDEQWAEKWEVIQDESPEEMTDEEFAQEHGARLAEFGCSAQIAQACTDLGYRFAEGAGGEADPERAEKYFKKACIGGDDTACEHAASAD